MKTGHDAFIRSNTRLANVPLLPEIRLLTADEALDLWHRTEAELDAIGLPPPFWAFPWAGGQALARYILDHPHWVAGKHVADFAAGSGLVGIAASMAGAAFVQAIDIDPFSASATRLNARLNGVEIDFVTADVIGKRLDVDVLLAGDVFYDADFAGRVIPWFVDLAKNGVIVLAGDPSRTYGPGDRAVVLENIEVPVIRAIEDAEIKTTSILRF